MVAGGPSKGGTRRREAAARRQASATAALNPTFDVPVPNATGYTVNVTNYDPAFNWTPTASVGSAASAFSHSISTCTRKRINAHSLNSARNGATLD